jgi:hypothetical protein
MLRHVALVTTDIVFLHSVRRLLVTTNIPSSPILITLMTEELRSSETLVLTRATQRNIQENLKSYIFIWVRTQNSGLFLCACPRTNPARNCILFYRCAQWFLDSQLYSSMQYKLCMMFVWSTVHGREQLILRHFNITVK